MKSIDILLILGLGLTASLWTGCEKYLEGVVHEIEFPEHEPALAVTMICDEGAEEVKLMVSRTAGVLEEEGSPVLEEVWIEMTLDGSPWVSLDASNFDGTIHRIPMTSPIDISGQTVEVAVEAEGLERVTAQDIMPPAPALNVTFEEAVEFIEDDWGGMIVRHSIEVDIAGRDGVADWFILTLESRPADPSWGDTNWYAGYINGPPDPRMQELNNGMSLVSDEGLSDGDINGLTFYIEHNASTEWEDIDLQYRVKVSAISESLARNLLSMDAHKMSQDNPFAEPVTVYSNISSGFGIMGMRNSTTFEIN